MATDRTFQKGDLILVTGVNGYIASHIAQQLLSSGYRVRGTARSTDKAKWLYERFDAAFGPGHFEAVQVADMVADNAFDTAVKGVAGIIHAASIMTFSRDPDAVIPPTVKGALNILTSASREPGVKALVYTSSSTAALLPVPDTKVVVTLETWDDDAVRQSRGKDPSGFVVYGASKTEAERAIWRAVERTHPPFRVNTVLPNANLGERINPTKGASSTGNLIPRLWEGDASAQDFTPQWFVDVKDTAKLHEAALVDPEVNGQRIFAFSEPFTMNDILGMFRRFKPEEEFLKDKEGEGRDLSEIPNQSAEALLRKHYNKGFTGLEQTVKENLGSLLA